MRDGADPRIPLRVADPHRVDPRDGLIAVVHRGHVGGADDHVHDEVDRGGDVAVDVKDPVAFAGEGVVEGA
ncbi:MAG: hypothetical protein ACK55I_20305, partial [bacterium]